MIQRLMRITAAWLLLCRQALGAPPASVQVLGIYPDANGTISTQTVTASGGSVPQTLADVGGQVLGVGAFGTLYGDGQQASFLVSVAAGSTTMTVTGGAFSGADVGKMIRAATASGNLIATIAPGTSGPTVILATGAQVALSGTQTVFWGHDDWPAIQAAVSSGKQTTLPQPLVGSTYWLSQSIVFGSNSIMHGPGFALATIKLMPGVNADVLQASGVYSLFGTGSTTSIDNWEFDNLTLDGNTANQYCSNPDKCNGIADYGAGWQLLNIRINNIKGHGLRTGYQQNGPGGAFVDNVSTLNVGRHGWWDAGPHDVTSQSFVAVDSSQEADNTYDGFFPQGSATGKHYGMHNWHNSTATNRVAHQLYDAAGGSVFVNSQFEGGRQEAYFAGNGTTCIGCKAYAPFGATTNALVVHAGNSNIWQGGTIGIADGQSYYGYQVGDSGAGLTAYGNTLTGAILSGFSTAGAFNFSADGGYNSIFGATGSSAAGGATTSAGTPSAYSQYNYDQSGTVIHFHTFGNGNNYAPAGNITGSGGAQNSVVSGGTGNSTGSNSNAFIGGGQSNFVTNYNGVVGGGTNNNAGAQSFIGGGQSNAVTGLYGSLAGGAYFSDRGRTGISCGAASGSFSASQGTAQSACQILRGTISSAAASRLTADGAAAGSANVVNISAATHYHLTISASCRDTTASGWASWDAVSADLDRQPSTTTVTYFGGYATATMATRSGGTLTGITLSVAPDNTNQGVSVTVTPAAGNTDTIHCVSKVTSDQEVQ